MSELDIKALIAITQVVGGGIFTIGGGFVVNYLRSISQSNNELTNQLGQVLKTLVYHERDIDSLRKSLSKLEDRRHHERGS